MVALKDAAPPRAVSLPATTATRWGAWLLAVSPVFFVLVVVTNLGTFAAADIGLFDDITRAQMDALGFGWVLASTLFPLAFIIGSVGIALLAGSLGRRVPATRVWAWGSVGAAAVAILLFLPYAPLRIAAMGFTEARLGDNALYTAWDTAGYIATDAAIAAVVLLCIALFVGTPHRTAALVLGILSIVLLIAAVAGLPVPPFAISFLWCALGIVWLRRSSRSRRAASALQ